MHAVTSEGTLLVASASGSQLGQYAWGADQVIFVVGAQKLVPTVEAGRERRIFEHTLPLEDARAYAAYGMNSRVGKILEYHQEDPGRIHIVIVREAVGFRDPAHTGRLGTCARPTILKRRALRRLRRRRRERKG